MTKFSASELILMQWQAIAIFLPSQSNMETHKQLRAQQDSNTLPRRAGAPRPRATEPMAA
jgi:hypothetical protein